MDLDQSITKDEFLQHCLLAADTPTDSEHCTICLEPFCADHKATQIPICKHVFGDACLKIWFSSAAAPNTCPLCRAVLFESEPGFITDSEDSETEMDTSEDEEILASEDDGDSDFDSIAGEIGEESDDEYEDVGIAAAGDRPQRRSSRRTQYNRYQSAYIEEERDSTLTDLKSGITRYVNDMWFTMWMLVEESRASVPTKPIKQEWLLATLANIESPVWCVSYTPENLLVAIARRMIRKHRECGRYIHGRDHTADVNSLFAEASAYL